METYDVEGMTCAACVAHVEKAVRSVDGVRDVTVSLLTNSMTVDGDVSFSKIVKAVEDAGYLAKKRGAQTEEKEDPFTDKETPKMVRRLIWSVFLLVPLMYVSMGHMMFGFPLPFFLNNNHLGMGMFQMLFCIVIMIINRRFFISGIKSTIHGAPNMDTLVALGSGVSFGYSVVVLFAMSYAVSVGDDMAVMKYMDEFYFESAATILTLITVGKTLEAYAKGKTTDALKGLMELAPKTATLLVDGQEVERPASAVAIGDIFIVRPGGSIPVDGVIIEGESAIDESSLTGESVPAEKTVGDEVSVGTMNRSGFLKCRATRVGEDTTLSKIIQMVSDAATTKAPIAKIADRVAAVFVPVVLVIAAVTAVIWLFTGATFAFALERAISVLVISCPCALGLATPVAIMVGNGVGAKNGILYKNAASLEAAGRADIVVLDKTGTITKGTPQVTDVLCAPGVTEDELMGVAYTLEEKSEHPFAKAILSYGQEKKIPALTATEFQSLSGSGVCGVIDQKEAFGGKRELIQEQTGDALLEFIRTKSMDAYAESGKTPLYFARDHKLLGAVVVADVMKEESPSAIAELREMGMHVVMLTGDNQKTAAAIGGMANVSEVVAGVLPDGKEEIIRRLQKKGRVIMVGDGINDAPALTRADVGFAIGAGTDIAIDAADVVLTNSKLSDVPAALRLSKSVIRNIHENLFWAFIYNVIGIPLAAGLWIPITGWTMTPMFGAAAMSLSSFCVVMNALRLNLIHIYDTGHFVKHRQDQDAPMLRDVSIDTDSKTETKEQEENHMSRTLNIEGMMCEKCEAHVRKALEGVEGVASVGKVSHDENIAEIETSGDVSDEALSAAIANAGYELKL